MAVHKGQAAGAIMVIGRHVGWRAKGPPFGHRRIEGKKAVIDAVRMLVQKGEDLGGAGTNHFDRLGVDEKDAFESSEVVPRIAIDEAIQGNTANSWITLIADSGDAGIGRALVNADALVVGIQVSVGPGQLGNVGAIDVIAEDPASDPAPVIRLTIRAIEHHAVIMIAGVQLPGELELLQIAEAGDALCFGFGFGQGRQQHRCQYGDDRDDDQQLDQGESLDGRAFDFTVRGRKNPEPGQKDGR